MSQLVRSLSQYWSRIQGTLFPLLEEELDHLTQKQQQLITVLELVRIEEFVHYYRGYPGRPPKNRPEIARALIAKSMYNLDTTVALIERLKSDRNLRRICGWESKTQIPCGSVFSRAFSDFAHTSLPQQVHAALIKDQIGKNAVVVSHNSRDSTAIEAREKPIKKSESAKKSKNSKRKGRPKKGSVQPEDSECTRLQKQKTMTVQEMLGDLPKACDKGAKKDSKGNTMYWVGYKLHWDVIDGCIPVSAIVTSASVHDSQVAIPLSTLTAQKITHCYELMDAAYDTPDIYEHVESLGRVPLIDKNPRRNQGLQKAVEEEKLARKTLNWAPAEVIRYNERTTVERANSRLKDEFGANKGRVRGHAKVACHLFFAILVLTADQLMKLVS